MLALTYVFGNACAASEKVSPTLGRAWWLFSYDKLPSSPRDLEIRSLEACSFLKYRPAEVLCQWGLD